MWWISIHKFQIAVLLASSESRDVGATAREAHLVRRAGINLYAIGVGQAKDSDELMAITDSSVKIYTPETYSGLKQLADTVVARICGGQYVYLFTVSLSETSPRLFAITIEHHLNEPYLYEFSITTNIL